MPFSLYCKLHSRPCLWFCSLLTVITLLFIFKRQKGTCVLFIKFLQELLYFVCLYRYIRMPYLLSFNMGALDEWLIGFNYGDNGVERFLWTGVIFVPNERWHFEHSWWMRWWGECITHWVGSTYNENVVKHMCLNMVRSVLASKLLWMRSNSQL